MITSVLLTHFSRRHLHVCDLLTSRILKRGCRGHVWTSGSKKGLPSLRRCSVSLMILSMQRQRRQHRYPLARPVELAKLRTGGGRRLVIWPVCLVIGPASHAARRPGGHAPLLLGSLAFYPHSHRPQPTRAMAAKAGVKVVVVAQKLRSHAYAQLGT